MFVVRASAGTVGSVGSVGSVSGPGTGSVANWVVDVQEKGAKGFLVQTVGWAGC